MQFSRVTRQKLYQLGWTWARPKPFRHAGDAALTAGSMIIEARYSNETVTPDGVGVPVSTSPSPHANHKRGK